MNEHEAIALATEISNHFSSINNIISICLGGSWAHGNASENSDLDIIIHYHLKNKPPLAALQQVAERLDDQHRPGLLSDFGAWGRQWNGGGILQVGGQRVDILYSNIDLMIRSFEDCLAGHISTEYVVNSPYGFHNYYNMGNIHNHRVLYDPMGELAALKKQTTPYPEKLKQAIIRKGLWEAGLSLYLIESAIARGDIYFVVGSFARSISCLVQVLFALNSHYLVGDKNALRIISTFTIQPASFSKIVAEIMAHPGETALQLKDSRALLASLLEECRRLSGSPDNQYDSITVPGM